MKAVKYIALGMLGLSMSACSTITTGTTQSMTVETPMTEGATCTLRDSKQAHWVVKSSPGTVEVTKGDGPMKVTCEKAGLETTSKVVQEGFAGMTLGNVLIGGGIGFIVDAASGAAQEYPDVVQVWMKPVNWVSEAYKQEWMNAKAEYDAKIETKKVQANTPDRNE